MEVFAKKIVHLFADRSINVYSMVFKQCYDPETKKDIIMMGRFETLKAAILRDKIRCECDDIPDKLHLLEDSIKMLQKWMMHVFFPTAPMYSLSSSYFFSE